MTNLSLSAAASGETKTADQNHKRAPDGADKADAADKADGADGADWADRADRADGADKADSTDRPDSTHRPDSADRPEGASDVGLAVTDVPDGWPAILQPIAAGDEGRKLMRDLVLRALV